MRFESKVQESCYEKILGWMREIFGDILVCSPDEPEIGVVVGSAYAQTRVLPFGDDALIAARAYLVTGVEPRMDLYEFLLHENEKMLLGGFGVDQDGSIFFQHCILGSTCDPPELRATVTAVTLIADRYDDEIVTRWGGSRATDPADSA